MTISCIIPTLNRGNILVETIRQLLGQDRRPEEIIVVDQSTQVDPETASALQQVVDRDDVRWLRQREPNASKARNAGAIAARGDVLLFLDDDIRVTSEFVAAHERNYKHAEVLAVSGQVLEGDAAVTTNLRCDPEDLTLGWISFPKNYAYRCKTAWMASGNFSVRRQVYLELGGMDENYARGGFREESDFAMRFLAEGNRFIFDPQASIVHLGAGVVDGGARSWSKAFEWHNAIGDWYFRVKYARGKGALLLMWLGFRHVVASRYKLKRPWLLIPSLMCWLASAPIALARRAAGPKLLRVQ